MLNSLAQRTDFFITPLTSTLPALICWISILSASSFFARNISMACTGRSVRALSHTSALVRASTDVTYTRLYPRSARRCPSTGCWSCFSFLCRTAFLPAAWHDTRRDEKRTMGVHTGEGEEARASRPKRGFYCFPRKVRAEVGLGRQRRALGGERAHQPSRKLKLAAEKAPSRLQARPPAPLTLYLAPRGDACVWQQLLLHVTEGLITHIPRALRQEPLRANGRSRLLPDARRFWHLPWRERRTTVAVACLVFFLLTTPAAGIV